MLHLIPAPLHRQLYRIAHRARRVWWRVRRPRHSSLVVIAFDDRDRVLLVRHSYGPRVWTLPGGGIGRGEHPEQAAVREIGEELGCELAGLTAIEIAEERVAGSFETRHIFVARLVGEPVPDRREIVAVAFVDPDRLPERSARLARERIAQAVVHWQASPLQQR
jgi:8-oxo-dGTP pyrophosphatase MutT (NUDIX family)